MDTTNSPTSADTTRSDFYFAGCSTVLLTVPRLAARLGIDVTLATETFQRTGSFKFRAAYAVASTIAETEIITSSSGNFGQAMAYACQLLRKRCTVVMPNNSAAVKVNAVREYGGFVDLIDTTKISREQRSTELAARSPGAYVASSYDDPIVIEGNATLGREFAALAKAGSRFDAIVVPIGGGGLSAGLVRGLRESGDDTAVIAAEPALRNIGAESLRRGQLIRSDREVQTIADGARTLSLGVHNWSVLKDTLAGIVEVSEAHITEAMRLLFGFANLKAEPTGALAIGALLEAAAERLHGQSVCCVITGGNVDPASYASVLRGEL